jgi:hypothetical protein
MHGLLLVSNVRTRAYLATFQQTLVASPGVALNKYIVVVAVISVLVCGRIPTFV